MRTTQEPLSQIAVACGLCDQAHLCRVFRRLIGMSPSAWRRAVPGDCCFVLLASTPSGPLDAPAKLLQHPPHRGLGEQYAEALLDERGDPRQRP
jgi:hypothetical protein